MQLNIRCFNNFLTIYYQLQVTLLNTLEKRVNYLENKVAKTDKMTGSTACVLCETLNTQSFLNVSEKEFGQIVSKSYLLCSQCGLVFLDRSNCLSPEEEKKRYLTHENTIDNKGYCSFLLKAWEPLKPLVCKSDKGLDFGSGPNPVLSDLIKSEGYNCKAYDPFFLDDKSLLNFKYNFILSTEVFEHFNSPKAEINLLLKLLEPGGYISVMTSPLTKEINFKNWHYRQDQTHISFFSYETYDWMAENLNLEIKYCSGPVVIFKKTDKLKN